MRKLLIAVGLVAGRDACRRSAELESGGRCERTPKKISTIGTFNFIGRGASRFFRSVCRSSSPSNIRAPMPELAA
jgi:hypothetical protein